MGLPQAYDAEVEGDDMLYFVYREKIKGYRLRIISGDKDFIQLMNYDCSIYNIRTNSPLMLMDAQLISLSPSSSMWIIFASQGINRTIYPDIEAVEKRLPKNFSTFRSIKQYLRSDEDFAGLNDKDKLREVYNRNRLLIDLKRFCRLHYAEGYRARMYVGKSSPEFDEDNYRTFCNKYRLKTMVYPAFIDIFKNLQR